MTRKKHIPEPDYTLDAKGNPIPKRQRIAFVPVCSGNSFGLGVAEENEPGYYPQEQHGLFPTYEAASVRAEELNGKLGLTPDEAAHIVCTSMRGKRKGGK